MLPFVEIRRQAAGGDDGGGRRIDQIVWKAGRAIDPRIAIVVEPAGVVIRDDEHHEIERLEPLKPVIPKRLGELQAQRVMLVHRNRQTRHAGRGSLDDHGAFTLVQLRGDVAQRHKTSSVTSESSMPVYLTMKSGPTGGCFGSKSPRRRPAGSI